MRDPEDTQMIQDVLLSTMADNRTEPILEEMKADKEILERSIGKGKPFNKDISWRLDRIQKILDDHKGSHN